MDQTYAVPSRFLGTEIRSLFSLIIGGVGLSP
jgi:hypothetical protein